MNSEKTTYPVDVHTPNGWNRARMEAESIRHAAMIAAEYGVVVSAPVLEMWSVEDGGPIYSVTVE